MPVQQTYSLAAILCIKLKWTSPSAEKDGVFWEEH